MKRVLLFTLLISFIGYSQNPIQPNIQNFEDGLPQDLVEKMKPMNLEFGDDEMMGFNPNQKSNKINSQSLERKMIVNEDVSYRLDILDTISFGYTGQISNKQRIEYDENGNPTLGINYDWDYNSQTFVPYFKSEDSYDENGNQTLIIFYIWNSESQSFVLNSKNEFSYDEKGNLTLDSRYSWDSESQSFVPDYKREWWYDENGNLTLNINYNWDSESQTFGKLTNRNFYYDENGNLTLRINQRWNSESQTFVTNSKFEYFYDENGNQTLDSRYSWDSESQTFVPSYKYESSYDENGNQTLDSRYSWDSESQTFVLDYKREWWYDENGNLTLELGEEIKKEYSYDENGNITLYIYYRWESFYSSFVPRFKYEYSYDENNFKTNETVYTWNQVSRNFKPLTKMDISTFSETDTKLVREGIMFEYDTNFNTWNELEGEEFKSYWYYTKESSLSTNSVELNSFSIYPNPTKGNLKINSSESLINPLFELYDIKGSKIFSKPFNFLEPIDVNVLKPSIYLYKIIDGNEVKQSGKVIKE
jgi:hypothetical protein